MARRSLVASFLASVMLALLLPVAALASPPPLPTSMAAVGDSITQAGSSGGSLGADYPANSWSTGTNTTVNSHYRRLLALDGAISGRAWNDSVSGAKMVHLAGQMQVAAARSPDYLTVLIGGNDLCTDTVAQMTSVTDFRAQFIAAMDVVAAVSPGTRVYVVSIPNAYQLWQLFRTDWWARTVWAVGDICQSLLANPTSNQTADVQRRATVAQRNADYNTQLAQVCALYAQCRFDGNAVFDTAFTKSDVSGDYFHPSIAGQAKIAAVSWAAGYWPAGGPPPDAPPTADFTSSCTGLECTFDASGSSDDVGIVSYAWTFGDGSTGTGVAPSRTYAAEGSYTVTLQVTDTLGQSATTSRSVSVIDPGGGPAVHLGAATGSAATRKGGWTATVTVLVADQAGAEVPGASVTGTWSTGASATCVTAASGSCAMTLSVNRKTPSVTWTVADIALTGATYDAGANVVESVAIAAP